MCVHLTLNQLPHLHLMQFELLFLLLSLNLKLLSLKFQLFYSKVCFLSCFRCQVLEGSGASSSFSPPSLDSLFLCVYFIGTRLAQKTQEMVKNNHYILVKWLRKNQCIHLKLRIFHSDVNACVAKKVSNFEF